MSWIQRILDWFLAFPESTTDDTDVTRDAYRNRIKRR